MLPMNWGCSKKASFERLLIFHELVFVTGSESAQDASMSS